MFSWEGFGGGGQCSVNCLLKQKSRRNFCEFTVQPIMNNVKVANWWIEVWGAMYISCLRLVTNKKRWIMSSVMNKGYHSYSGIQYGRRLMSVFLRMEGSNLICSIDVNKYDTILSFVYANITCTMLLEQTKGFYHGITKIFLLVDSYTMLSWHFFEDVYIVVHVRIDCGI